MKDPAVLFYISDWLTSTSEMDSDCKGWYLNLILHNYDKGSLPNDIEKLAVLAGVKFSEFKRFEHVFEHVLKQKFEPIDEQRLSNLKAQTILKDRECFKDKRSEAGKKSYLMKFFAKNYTKEYKNKKIYNFVNLNIDTNIDTKNQTEIEHMFKHLFELYINEIEIENKDKSGIIIEDKNNFKTWTIEDFQNSILAENKTDLSNVELNKFYDYWRETTPSGKFRFQTNQTWETGLRLNTWRNNQKQNVTKTKTDEVKGQMLSAFEEAIFNINNK